MKGEGVIPILKYQFGFFFSLCDSHNFQPCIPSDSKETSNGPEAKRDMIVKLKPGSNRHDPAFGILERGIYETKQNKTEIE